MQKRSNIQSYFSRPYEQESTQRFLPSDIVSEIERYTSSEYDMIKEMLENIFSFIRVPGLLNIDAIVPEVVKIYRTYYENSIGEFLEKWDKDIRVKGIDALTDNDVEFIGGLFRYLFINDQEMYDRINDVDYEFIYPYLGYLLLEEGYVDRDSLFHPDDMRRDALRTVFRIYIESFRGKQKPFYP